MFRFLSNDLLQQNSVFKSKIKLNINTLFNLKQASVSGDFFFYVIGGSSLVIICVTILYLVYRKRQMSNFYAIEGAHPGEEIIKTQDPNKENENKGNVNCENNIIGDLEQKNKADLEEDDEIKVQGIINVAPNDFNDLSIDRSKSDLLRKSSIRNQIENSPNKNQDNLDRGNEKELEKEEDIRAISEHSNVSKLSAHKIVIRNYQKELVCFTNGHRSEPDVDVLNNDFNKNFENNENDDEKISADDIESFSQQQEDSSYEEEEEETHKGLKEIINHNYQSPNNINDMNKPDLSKILSIKEKRKMSDFDEKTQDVVQNFIVYKQEDVKRETKTHILDISNKKTSSNQNDESNDNTKSRGLKKQITKMGTKNNSIKGK